MKNSFIVSAIALFVLVGCGSSKTKENVPPKALSQSVTLNEDSTKSITLAGSDAEGNALTYSVVTAPAHGTFVNGVYTPTANYFGSDSFTFKANDGKVDSAPATVSIMITDVAEPNTAPTATAQSVTLDEDTTKSITLAGTDAEGDALTYAVVTSPAHGTFANGVYTPTANYFGSDSFTFKANDGKADSAPATVTIMITDVAEPNTAPTAMAQSVTLDEDTTKSITLAGTDAEGDTLTYIVVTPASHGTYTNGVYTPTANYNGADSFTFKANDGKVDSTPATVSITVTSVNDAPTVDAGADANITEGDSFAPSPTSSDSDGAIASTVWSEGVTTLTFPKTDFTAGEHILTVTVTDNEGATATDTLTLTVNSKLVTCTPLPKTGQTTVYTNYDDGHYQKGAAVSPRFVRDSTKEIVKDNVTGFTWQDDNDAKTLTKTWQEAIDYCDASTLGSYTDWRLPTIEELVYITDKGRVNPAIDPVFKNVSSSGYWSSTTYVDATSNAWLVYFGGSDYYNGKTADYYVCCVRDGN